FFGTGGPDFFVKTGQAAVEMVGTIVDGQGVGDAVEEKLAAGDAVGVTASDAAEVGAALFVVAQSVKTLYHVGLLAVFIRHGEADNSTPVIGDFDFVAPGVAEREQQNGLSGTSGAERSGRDVHFPRVKIALKQRASAKQKSGRGPNRSVCRERETFHG